jgi:glycosyltransferase involved in cell wall biosynthesis
MALTIAYLVNQYPKVSHSFIRREIAGLERCGIEVERFSVRSCLSELVDDDDIQEFQRTRTVLDASAFTFIWSLLSILLSRPLRFFNSLQRAMSMGWVAKGAIFHHCAYLLEACVLVKWFEEADVSHVHAHFGTNSTTVALLCKTLGGPSYSFTVHGPEEFDRPEVLSLKEKISEALFVVGVSHFGRSQLYRWSDHKQWHKIHVVRCGVDETFLAHPLSPIPNEPNFVCVGRLSEQKGHFLLLEAAKRLAQEGHDFHLSFVGDGELREDIEQSLQHNGLTDKVTITGWASGAEVRKYLLNSRALVLPSFAEGLPVVIMEALALGRPVISTYVAGIPELVEPNTCGWLVPAGSVDSLVDALRMALQSSTGSLEEMGKAGYQRVGDRHSVAIEANRLADLFKVNLAKIQSNVPSAMISSHEVPQNL